MRMNKKVLLWNIIWDVDARPERIFELVRSVLMNPISGRSLGRSICLPHVYDNIACFGKLLPR